MSIMRSRTLAPSGAGADLEESYDYDLFVIGAGSGGVRGSRTSAGFGAMVVICEIRLLRLAGKPRGHVSSLSPFTASLRQYNDWNPDAAFFIYYLNVTFSKLCLGYNFSSYGQLCKVSCCRVQPMTSTRGCRDDDDDNDIDLGLRRRR